MEFRRIEVRRVTRYYENLAEENDIRETLEKLKLAKVLCNIEVTGYPVLETSYILEVGDKVGIFSREQRLKIEVETNKIKRIEVFSNVEVTEEDHRGRWDFI